MTIIATAAQAATASQLLSLESLTEVLEHAPAVCALIIAQAQNSEHRHEWRVNLVPDPRFPHVPGALTSFVDCALCGITEAAALGVKA